MRFLRNVLLTLVLLPAIFIFTLGALCFLIEDVTSESLKEFAVVFILALLNVGILWWLIYEVISNAMV